MQNMELINELDVIEINIEIILKGILKIRFRVHVCKWSICGDIEKEIDTPDLFKNCGNLIISSWRQGLPSYCPMASDFDMIFLGYSL